VRRAEAELSRLEALAKSQAVRIIYSRHLQRGGHCRVRGRPVVLIGSQLSPDDKLEVLQQGLSSLLPELLAGSPEPGPRAPSSAG
jgi:hypothetical protein